MTPFQVWAPHAQRVEIDLAGDRHPMVRADYGWWHAEVALADRGDYRFVLDDGEALPDPRSLWQPRGIHGASRMVDHKAFLWTDQRWQAGPLSAAIIYELHVGTFTPQGTFAGVIDKLDYLSELGITHIELMPVAERAASCVRRAG